MSLANELTELVPDEGNWPTLIRQICWHHGFHVRRLADEVNPHDQGDDVRSSLWGAAPTEGAFFSFFFWEMCGPDPARDAPIARTFIFGKDWPEQGETAAGRLRQEAYPNG